MEKKKIVVIGGPTATGKTSLAVKLAAVCGGEIISADSVQIYKNLDIGSAKPSKEEMGGIPHYLIDEISPFDSFSVYDFTVRAKKYAEDIISRGKIPIIAGGTGLYISSFTDNIEFSDKSSGGEIRRQLNEKAEKLGASELYRELRVIDEAAAEKIHPNNIKRVVRALEIYYTTGITMTKWNERSKQNVSPYEFIKICLTAPREILYNRINERVDKMMQRGLKDEVKALTDMGLGRNHQSMQAIGYKELLDFFEGKMSEEEATEEIKKASRRYAKRQLTWFRRDNEYIRKDISLESENEILYSIKRRI